MMDVKKYAETLASMCISFINGSIDEETFKANLNVFNSVLNPSKKDDTIG